MQKRSFLTVVMFLIGMFMTGAYAQVHTVSGLVKDKEMGEPLVGVSVSVKGTKNATMTDLNGNYTIQTSPKDVLEFKYVGMKNAEETVGNRKVINVTLVANAESLGEVVVTAMGIKRQSETLTYSAQTVGGKDVNDIKSINMINSLQGKSAGLQITPNSTGAGGSSKILFRGNKSISGSNQPLIVIDGVPTMTNTATSQVSSDYGGERDAGDVMSTINPDDIASITLLKGAAASALYGAVAANGAIMITTKQGMAGKVNVNVSSNTTMEIPMILPEFQNTYGAGADGTFSWGDKLSKACKNYAESFFRTGFTTNNTVSLSGGSENFKGYFSYGNVFSHGMTPENTFRSHNLNTKVDFKVLDNVYVDFSAKYSNQYSKNQAAASGTRSQAYTSLRAASTGTTTRTTTRFTTPHAAATYRTGATPSCSSSATLTGCSTVRLLSLSATAMSSVALSSGTSLPTSTSRDVCATSAAKSSSSTTLTLRL